MTCGGKTCTTTHPIEFARGIDVPSCASWLSDIFAYVILAFERARHRAVLAEFEKVYQRGTTIDPAALGSAIERQRQRQRLLDLDERLLADIGLTREQAEREARRPFWK